MDVALVAALALARAEQVTAREIAEQAWYLETVEAKIPGGKQDQFAAALGGFQRLTFRDPDVGVEPITLDPAFATALARRTVLCYTGRSRVSGATIARPAGVRSEEHTSELQSQSNLVCRLLLEKKKIH